jgi:sigma-E factor negative regulatory protein RseB
VIRLLSHWRLTCVAVVLTVTGTCAVALAMHDDRAETVNAYTPLPVASHARREAPLTRTAAAREALQLLTEAATACKNETYSGIQVSRWWGLSGNRVSLIAVWHRPGGGIVVRALTGAAGPPAGQPVELVPGVPMSVSPRLLDLLQANYLVSYAGTSSADGRPAKLVLVIRPNGKLAARYWLDSQTKLPLRRQLFDDHARLVSDIRLVDLQLGHGSLGGMPATGVQPSMRPLDGGTLAALRAKGWPLPGQLPGGLELFAASETTTSSGTVVDASYSDGLSVISLFVQRGDLPAVLTGWQRVEISGHDVFAGDPDDTTIAWSGGGYVFTMIADAPATTVDRAIAALPHSDQSGFWTRLGRGLRRLASWANPFH